MSVQYRLLGAAFIIFSYGISAKEQLPIKNSTALEEIVVTAQKRMQSAQDIPIAISVLDSIQLETLGVSSLEALRGGVIPSLRIDPHSNATSTLAVAIRGNGPVDVVQATRESSVAIYQDGIYLGRAQGLAMDFFDLERVEVLRGPQGTLFGRNATTGAISLVSKKLKGVFGFKQKVGVGSYDAFRSVTQISLPEFHGIRTKIDYIQSEQDGWVKNTAPGEPDYNQSEKNGGRISLYWQATNDIHFDYTYDRSKIETTQVYFQLYEDTTGLIGQERERETKTRFPIELDPSKADLDAHGFTATWIINDKLTAKSLSGYRELKDNSRNNYAGVLASNGLILAEDTNQDQLSQEIQLIGSQDQFEWVTGLYYFKEKVHQDISIFFSLEDDLTPINPPTTIIPGTTINLPTNFVDAIAKSTAIYGQGTWTWDNRMHLTLGVRYTRDEKSGEKTQFLAQTFNFNSDNLDTTLTLAYDWSPDLSSYVKWGSAYRAGGVNVRSATFSPFDKEEVETWEIGVKSEFWDQRVRLNAAVFSSKYENMQFDFVNPVNVTVNETLNAIKTVEIGGFELDVAVAPIRGLVLGLNYTYLDSDMPLQPNPLDPRILQEFRVTQTPKHAGSLIADYTFAHWSLGLLQGHLDITSTDRFSYVSLRSPHQDSYTLFNARLTLTDINLGAENGSLSVSLWGKI